MGSCLHTAELCTDDTPSSKKLETIKLTIRIKKDKNSEDNFKKPTNCKFQIQIIENISREDNLNEITSENSEIEEYIAEIDEDELANLDEEKIKTSLKITDCDLKMEIIDKNGDPVKFGSTRNNNKETEAASQIVEVNPMAKSLLLLKKLKSK
jgi:hypothetical protein